MYFPNSQIISHTVMNICRKDARTVPQVTYETEYMWSSYTVYLIGYFSGVKTSGATLLALAFA